jgi:hypothetical protein
MRTFSFYIHDVRHVVPTLAFITASDEQRAREIAKERLMESLDHLAIEVRENDWLLFSLDRNGTDWINHSNQTISWGWVCSGSPQPRSASR